MDSTRMNEDQTEELMTPREVAAYLRTGYRRVLDLIALGELRAYRIGRVFRISREDLQRYLKSTRVESPWSNQGL